MSVIDIRMQKIVDKMIQDRGETYTAGYLESQLAGALHELPWHRVEYVLRALELKFEVEKKDD